MRLGAPSRHTSPRQASAAPATSSRRHVRGHHERPTVATHSPRPHAGAADGSSELQEAEAFKSAVLGALIQSVGLQPQRSLGSAGGSGLVSAPSRNAPKVRSRPPAPSCLPLLPSCARSSQLRAVPRPEGRCPWRRQCANTARGARSPCVLRDESSDRHALCRPAPPRTPRAQMSAAAASEMEMRRKAREQLTSFMQVSWLGALSDHLRTCHLLCLCASRRFVPARTCARAALQESPASLACCADQLTRQRARARGAERTVSLTIARRAVPGAEPATRLTAPG